MAPNKRNAFRRVPITELHEDPANARRHGERNRATVRASLQEFGQVEALVVEAGTGRVLGGNCRLAELRELSETEVWVYEADVHGGDASRLSLALNRSAELAEWDDEGLADLLESLHLEGCDFDAIGWSSGEIDLLLNPGSVDDVKWKEFDETIGDGAPKGKQVKCPHCGETFDV